MTSAAYLEADANLQRHGNMYSRATGARITALNPEGAKFPALEVYSFPGLAELIVATEGFDGNVTFHESPNGPLTVVMMNDDTGPVDHFVKVNGKVVRSDRWGNPTTILETLKPDHSGVIATGEVGPGSTGGTQPTQPAPIPQVANGQVIVCGLGKTIRNVGAAFTARLHLENGQRRLVRIAEYGHSISAVMTYSIASGDMTTPRTESGTDATILLRATDSPALLGQASDGSYGVHSGTVDIPITRAMPDGVASGDVVIDVQEAR